MNREWKTLGKDNPYFGVCSSDEYKNSNLSQEALNSFFSSGEQHINWVMDIIRKTLDPNFKPLHSLDFGCGVGRLVVPLASLSARVDGIDISAGMLAEAGKNLENLGIKNVNLIESKGSLVVEKEKYDFIHSFIVFQHIAVQNGIGIFEQLLDSLKKGGVGALHFTYMDTAATLKKFKRKLLRYSLFNGLKNLLKREPLSTPNMQMNEYPLKLLFSILQSRGIQNVVVEYTNHSGYLGVMLFFKK